MMFATLAAGLTLTISLYNLKRGLAERLFSSLYWFTTIVIFALPAFSDSIFGLPALAYREVFSYYFPNAESGMARALWFAVGELLVTTVVYRTCSRRFLRPSSLSERTIRDARYLEWFRRNEELLVVFAAAFCVSAAVTVWAHRDLTEAFTSYFLSDTARPQYELYLFVASAPLMSLCILRAGLWSPSSLAVAGGALFCSYYVGIRYYAIFFLGLGAWQFFVLGKRSLRGRITAAIMCAVIGWIGTTLWGVSKALNLRAQPIEAIRSLPLETLVETLQVGPEPATRMAFYDVIARLDESKDFRWAQGVDAALTALVYPRLLLSVGWHRKVDTGVFVAELQGGEVGSGESTTSTSFGADWVNWGWWGTLIGGVIWGITLLLVDFLWTSRPAIWLFVGPVLTFVCVYGARAGVYDTLHFVRALQITLLLYLCASLLQVVRKLIPRNAITVEASRLSMLGAEKIGRDVSVCSKPPDGTPELPGTEPEQT